MTLLVALTCQKLRRINTSFSKDPKHQRYLSQHPYTYMQWWWNPFVFKEHLLTANFQWNITTYYMLVVPNPYLQPRLLLKVQTQIPSKTTSLNRCSIGMSKFSCLKLSLTLPDTLSCFFASLPCLGKWQLFPYSC